MDFVFVEMGENEGDAPIIDGVSLNRLRIEWKAIKAELKDPHGPISSDLWSVLITLIKRLEFTNEVDVTIFLNESLIDIAETLGQTEYRTVKQWVLHLFTDLLLVRQRPLVCYETNSCARILRQLSSFFVDIDVKILDNFLEPFQADDIFDDGHQDYPFLTFLVQSVCGSQQEIAEKAKSMILEIMSRRRFSMNHLIPILLKVIPEYMEFCSRISPTIFEGCLAIQLLTYFNETLSFINNKTIIDQFVQNFSENVMKPLAQASSQTQFKTFSVFVQVIDHYPTLSAIIETIVDKNGPFGKNILSWLRSWPTEGIQLLKNLLNRRCAAVVSAYFFDEHLDTGKKMYGFPEIPTSRSKTGKKSLKLGSECSIEVFQKFRIYNPELPGNTSHVVSVFPFLLDLVSSFWSLPEETSRVLFDVCERIAGIGNRNCYSFCFTPGSSLYFEVARLLTTFDQGPEPLRNLLMSFIWTMSKILEFNPEASL